ncbi:hypothetical protein JCM10296v2_004653 [Rhodotorula toruloides]
MRQLNRQENGVLGGRGRYRICLKLDQPEKTNQNALDLLANPHDVRLSFPRHGGQLWTRSDVLARLPPCFKTLLSSGFADSVSVPAKRARTAGQKRAVAVPPQEEEDSNDSDDETDQLYFTNNPLDGDKEDEEEAVGAYEKVTITGSAFTTYRAVLAYLRSGYIAFAPLSSTCSPVVGASTSRQNRLQVAAKSKPDMPYPVSPKSTFRLAHLLELEDLQRLCLSNVQETLAPDSAAHELFDEVSVLHEAWRRVVIEYVVATWDVVHATKGWKEVERKVEEEEVHGAAKIMVQLSRAREKARDLDLLANPHDVRFVFSETGGDLWARSDILARSSPYFAKILASESAEAVTVPSKRARTSKGKSPASAIDADDEDKHPAAKQEPEESPKPFKEIKIAKTAFTTYRAILACLRPGHIAFAPLSSALSSAAAPGARSRSEVIAGFAAQDENRPYLVSPRSAFRLAHRLELDDLKSLCLSSMRENLTPETAPHELFSEVSVAHASWRNTIVDFVVRNCVKVCATDGWKEVQEKVDADEIPGAAPIMMRLLLAKDGVKR